MMDLTWLAIAQLHLLEIRYAREQLAFSMRQSGGELFVA